MKNSLFSALDCHHTHRMEDRMKSLIMPRIVLIAALLVAIPTIGSCAPKMEAKMEKKTMGTTNESIVAARSRRRFIQPVRMMEKIIRAAPSP